MSKTKLVFFGSSIYSVTILNTLISLSDFDVITVVTKPDKATGRSQAITANPVSKFSQKNHLALLQPSQFDSNFRRTFKKLKPDIALCVAYGPPFFTQELIDIPKYKIVNIHPSPLPKYRGATPGPWQIINGETSSSVCFFQIDALPDHGPIIANLPFNIKSTWTSHDFYSHAFNLAGLNLQTILKSYISNPTKLTVQDHSQKTYFPKLSKENAKINWSWPTDKINRFVLALNPWPIAWTEVKNSKNQILSMKIFSSQAKTNIFTPLDVQIESKSKTTWDQIKNYYKIIS